MEVRMAKVGIGFLGAGDVAYLHQLAIRKIPTAQVVAVFDVDGKKSRHLASDLGAKLCASADELVNLPQVQVVFVLTPEPAHHADVMRSLRAGKHTFVEKPVAFSPAPIREWIDLSKRQSCLCVPGHNYIHAPALRSMKKLIASGELGEIHTLWILFMFCLPDEIRRRVPGPLREVMIHHFYSMLYLVGKPESVLATSSDFSGRGPTQADQALVICKLPGGGQAILFASFATDDLTNDPWTVVYKVLGSEGSASHNWGLSRLRRRPQPAWDLPAYYETFQEEDRYLINECVLAGEKPLSNLEDALVCLDILSAAEKSIATGATQNL
jgi:predicted dehydrogenase